MVTKLPFISPLIHSSPPCSDLRAVVSGKDVPEEVKSRLLGLHEDNVQMKEQIKTLTDKLLKAKQV